MPVVTLQSFKRIGRLEVGKLGRGPQMLLVVGTLSQCIHASYGTTCQVAFFRAESYIFDF